MNPMHDPVDDALDLLRSAPTAPPGDALERRITAARRHAPSAAVRWQRTGLAAALVAVLGGTVVVAPAAVQTLRRWLLPVEINGTRTDIEMDENGAARLTVPTGAGPADIAIETARTADGGRRTVVSVTTDDVVAEQEAVVTDRPGPAPVVALTPEEIAAATVLAEWMDDEGRLHQLLARPNAAADGTELLLRSTLADDRPPARRLAAAAPLALLDPASTKDVSIGDDGSLSIDVADATGEFDRLVFRLAADGSGRGPDEVRVRVPGLDLRVPVGSPPDPSAAPDSGGEPPPR